MSLSNMKQKIEQVRILCDFLAWSEAMLEEEAVMMRVSRKRSAFGKSGAGWDCFNGTFAFRRSFLSMGVVKGDDSAITWDSIAMEQDR